MTTCKRNETAPPLTASPASPVSFWSIPRRLVHDRVEVGVRKPVLLDAREEPEEGGRVGDVGGRRLASTTGEDAADAAEAVRDDGARIAGRGEGTRLVVVRENSPLHRGLVSIVAKIFADVREYTGSAAYGNASGIAVLDNQQARFTVVVEHIWLAHEVFRDEVPKWEEAAIRILEGRGSVDAGVHLKCELVLRNLRAWI